MLELKLMMSTAITLLDGAMGTELRDRGCTVPSHLNSIWSAQVLLDAPETVREVHEDYIDAGADVVIANNYAVTHDLLERVGMGDRVQELTELAVDLALQAKQNSGKEVKVAGSVPPLNTSYRADLVGDYTSIVAKYAEIVEVLAAKADLIMIETMASSLEAKAALEACKSVDKPIYLGFTLQGNRKNTLPSGESLDEAIEAIKSYDFQALLLNCCATNQITEGLEVIAGTTNLPFGGYANPQRITQFSTLDGVDKDPEGSRKESAITLGVEAYLKEVKDWLKLGATIVGGCCHTKPAFIRAMREEIRNYEL